MPRVCWSSQRLSRKDWKDAHDDIGNVHGVRVRALEWSMVAVGGARENLLEELTS